MARRPTTPTTPVATLALAAAAGLAALAVALPAAATATPAPTATAWASQPAPTAQPALAALATVTVKGRAPKTGYARDQFGKAWADVDGNGCDTRNDVLNRDLTTRTHVKGTRDCVVYTGTLADPYSGRSISFVRGPSTSTAVQVDHVVALSDAWQKGAQGWDVKRRTAFANDPLNLVAADGPLNAAKGDGDAATWLPPSKASRCAYVARQVAVKLRYGLWMTQAERDASSTVLTACPTEPLPTGGALLKNGVFANAAASAKPTVKPTVKPTTKPSVTAKPTTKPTAKPAVTAKPTTKPTAKPTAKTPAKATPSSTSVRYADCDAVRAAGKAPIRQTDPGFRPAFDRDGDGVGCDR